MRLINADALIKKLTGKNFKLIHVDQLEAIIKNFPTAEVPITHGHWIDKSVMPEYFEYECSVCGKGHVIAMTPYCYMCGAKMERMKK